MPIYICACARVCVRVSYRRFESLNLCGGVGVSDLCSRDVVCRWIRAACPNTFACVRVHVCVLLPTLKSSNLCGGYSYFLICAFVRRLAERFGRCSLTNASLSHRSEGGRIPRAET